MTDFLFFGKKEIEDGGQRCNRVAALQAELCKEIRKWGEDITLSVASVSIAVVIRISVRVTAAEVEAAEQNNHGLNYINGVLNAVDTYSISIAIESEQHCKVSLIE